MSSVGHLIFLFGFKVMDNLLGTTKTLLVQRNRAALAGLALGLSNFIYMYITKDIVMSNNIWSLVIVSIASGLGCYIAVKLGNHFSKDKTYVNVILSDDIDAMKQLRDFLAENKITNVASDSYTRDWSKKTLTITAYAETRDQSKLIDDYIESNDVKFKRLVQNKKVK